MCGRRPAILQNDTSITDTRIVTYTRCCITRCRDWNVQFCITKESRADIFLPLHANVNVTGLLTTLWSSWITVDVQNRYIYSYMRTAIITSVRLEDKAGFMRLCLRGNSLNVVRDERKNIFSDTIRAWKRCSRNSLCGKANQEKWPCLSELCATESLLRICPRRPDFP